MKAKKKSKAKWIIAALVLLCIATLFYLGSRFQASQPVKPAADIRSAAAEKGTITTVVSGTGVLESGEAETVTYPAGVTVDTLLVSAGGPVRQGDVLATLEQDSIRSALADIQNQLASLKSQLEQEKSKSESAYLTAGVSGRVKGIFAAEGDSVSGVTLERGGLLLLSLDGKMMISLPGSNAVSVGSEVTVTLPDGAEKEGVVAEQTEGALLVTLTDDGPNCGDTVTVTAEDGTALGTGTLDVHSPLLVAGYRGTVEDVLVKENAKVYANTKLFQLRDLGHSPEYEQLCRQHQEAIDTLQELLLLEKQDGILAPFDGTVQAVGTVTGTLCTISPNEDFTIHVNVDELDILSMELGQEAAVTVSAAGEEPVSGKITGINTLGLSANGVTKYAVEITLPKSERMLPGMNASVEIAIGRSENCLTIPEDALNQSGTTTFVYTAYDPETDTLSGETAIVTGVSDGNRVEIVSGLTENATVYYRYKEAESTAPWEDMTPWEDYNPQQE